MTILPLLLAYLLGSIPFGLLISKLAGIGDIRDKGSGNIGATNVWRVAGFKVAVWVYLFDIGKAVVAVMLAQVYLHNYIVSWISPELYVIFAAVCCVLGSVFSIFLRFKGGKGVNAALGAMVTLLPLETIIAFGVFLVVVLVSKMISLGSLMAAITLLGTVLLEVTVFNTGLAIEFVVFTVLLVILIFYSHRSNIKRILNGTENKFNARPNGGTA